MKTLLIVEDEKMIRQGLKAMVKRSGVKIEQILECKNGEEALGIINHQKVDVLFTDIRMPKMDGLTLLNKLNEREDSPEIVVISGYDDFSYAVEALKCGAREYILKPVNREDVYKIMNNLEKIIARKNRVIEKLGAIEDILKQQIKYILMNSYITNSELKSFKQSFESHWINSENYQIFCLREQIALPEEVEAILCEVEEHYIVICNEKEVSLLEGSLKEKRIGLSSKHKGVMHLRIAYEQALLARKYAYMMNLPCLKYEDVPMQQNTKIDNKALTKFVQLIGTERYDELSETFESVLGEDLVARMLYKDFEDLMRKLIESILEHYCSVIDPIDFGDIKYFYKYDTYKSYKEHLKHYLLMLNDKIHSTHEKNKNNTQMKEVVDYIYENYNKDLNMAMVSNHISMNYSCFSQIFKEYTGKNFVNYIKEVRINKAKELLQDTTKKVAEVGYAVGYENEKHFMKVFKSITGISPTEYRRNSDLAK